MPRRIIRHEFDLAVAPEIIAGHLAEPRNYLGLSPLIVEVRDIADVDGTTQYTAVERFPLPFGRHLDNHIRVTLRRDDGDPAGPIVGGDVRSPGWVRMRYRYDITAGGAGAHVVDELDLRAPFGLMRFAAGQARSVQLARAAILADRLTGAPEIG
ncbi:SRPBCC family protein [Agromyces sp. M3QZ16-3]|uniref:SRPBCC family protein n=1 Tax=Agromyces sp. M3QZ16-3 TaxID=3447585 RepID=UPI003F691214